MHSRPIALLALALSATVLGGCTRAQRLFAAPASDLLAEPVPLCHLPGETVRAGRLEFRGGLALTWPGHDFGGWSDLHVKANGTGMLAVGDDGHWLLADLHWDAGRLLRAWHGSEGLLAGEDCPGKLACDAEALAVTQAGLWVAFENRDRIRRFPLSDPPFSQPAQDVPRPPRLPTGTNYGLEVLTPLLSPVNGPAPNQQRLLAIQEGPEDPQPALLPAWLWDGTAWTRLQYRTTPGFRPTGATLLPPGSVLAGDLLVLERYWRGGVSQTRVAVVKLPEPEGILEPQTVAVLAAPMLALDNYEGIAAVQVDGETRVLLLSDDNHASRQRTLLLAFALVAEPGRGCEVRR